MCNAGDKKWITIYNIKKLITDIQEKDKSKKIMYMNRQFTEDQVKKQNNANSNLLLLLEKYQLK